MTRYILFTILAFTLITTAKAQKSDTLKGLEADTLVFVTVEHEPKFPGGMRHFYEYITTTISYPAEARKNHSQGKVFVSMIVEKDGSISNVKVVRGVTKELDEEAIRVIKGSPKWNPGTQNGEPVRVRYTIPFSFYLP